jgi:hypothetical protein
VKKCTTNGVKNMEVINLVYFDWCIDGVVFPPLYLEKCGTKYQSLTWDTIFTPFNLKKKTIDEIDELFRSYVASGKTNLLAVWKISETRFNSPKIKGKFFQQLFDKLLPILADRTSYYCICREYKYICKNCLVKECEDR